MISDDFLQSVNRTQTLETILGAGQGGHIIFLLLINYNISIIDYNCTPNFS
jgi:hypothetical protein